MLTENLKVHDHEGVCTKLSTITFLNHKPESPETASVDSFPLFDQSKRQLLKQQHTLSVASVLQSHLTPEKPKQDERVMIVHCRLDTSDFLLVAQPVHVHHVT